MVIGKIGMEIAKGVLNAEKGILGKAWWGFKAKREIVAGIRTGLGLGAGIGSFINDSSSPYEDGQVPFKSSPGKFSQKYRRFGKSRRFRRNNNYCRPSRRRQRLFRHKRYSSYRR